MEEQVLIAAMVPRKTVVSELTIREDRHCCKSTRACNCKFHMLLLSSLLLQLMICACPVSGRRGQVGWDGVIITEVDYDALQAFKHELVDPNGFLRSWNDSGYGACSGGWTGIKCAQGQVIVLQLPWKGLSGRITEKIGELQALRKLSLHDNSIGGQIPSSLGLLQNLRGLQLFNNRLSGTIPPSLAGPALQTLDLSNNLLIGSIPDNLISNSKNQLLYRLNLSFNSISGPIPLNLTQSPSLMFLHLNNNNLTGPIPHSWAPANRLTTLDLSYNAINGTLPSTFPSSLHTLNLKSNNLDGPIIINISSSSLTFLDLSLNNFTGQIPISLGDLKNLHFLNVSYNNLSGQVPTVLTEKFNSSSFIGNVQLCGFSFSITNPACPSSSPPPSQQQQKQSRHGLGTKDIILIAAGILLAILLVICFILICCLIRKGKTGQPSSVIARAEKGIAVEEAAVPGGGGGGEGGGAGGKLVHFDGGGIVFTADDLLCATAEIMGKSTYGTVYKATLEDGSQVAVKRLREKITKGQKEFETEVNVLGKIRHPNLIPMRAYYVGPKGEKLLVFDYMPRGSLATFLHARGPDTPINWATRMRIIQGMARGLSHLHHMEKLIHGNLTSNNILLLQHRHHEHVEEEEEVEEDNGVGAMISDYGLSRLMNPSAGPNVIAAAAALGYRAPELSKLKKANAKTDVYSFGVIVLEILTGKSPAGGDGDLPQWVASIVKEEWTNEVFDVELMSDAASIGDELLNTLKLALHCVDPSPAARPEARQIVQHLQEIRASSPSPTRPAEGGGGGPSTSGLSATATAAGPSGSDEGGRQQSD